MQEKENGGGKHSPGKSENTEFGKDGVYTNYNLSIFIKRQRKVGDRLASRKCKFTPALCFVTCLLHLSV